MKRNRKWLPLVVSVIAVLYFGIPILAASEFSFRKPGSKGSFSTDNFSWIIHHDGFAFHLLISLKLALMAAAIVIVLMVPTVVLVNLGAQRWKRVVEFVCIIPLVVPVVSLAIGAQVAMPEFLQNWQYELAFFYVIIALPYTYRALDVGVSAVPLKTLVEASRSLGASWVTCLATVVVPAIRGSVLGASFLTIALSLGEFTITSLLHWDTFTTWTVIVAQENILGSIALSVLSLVGAIAILAGLALIGPRRKAQVA